MKPTQEQIQAEIEKLQEMKPKVRQHTAFGEDNHAAIEVQIRVLEQNLDEWVIFDQWDMIDDYLCANALYAREWLDGGGEPMSGPNMWGSLVRG